MIQKNHLKAIQEERNRKLNNLSGMNTLADKFPKTLEKCMSLIKNPKEKKITMTFINKKQEGWLNSSESNSQNINQIPEVK